MVKQNLTILNTYIFLHILNYPLKYKQMLYASRFPKRQLNTERGTFNQKVPQLSSIELTDGRVIQTERSTKLLYLFTRPNKFPRPLAQHQRQQTSRRQMKQSPTEHPVPAPTMQRLSTRRMKPQTHQSRLK